MKNLLILIAFLAGLSSCIVERPSHSGISTYHKENNIKSVQSPSYKKKSSFTGITFQIGATAGGALAGMALSPTTFYGSDNKSTTNVVLNGVIGGAVGYGITSLMYVIQGQGKKRSMQPNKFPQWLDEYNRRHIGQEYVFTGFTNYSGYLVLPNNRKTENNYTASNVEQAIMFKNAFPYSSRNAAFETQAANRIYTQSDAILFLEYYPNSIYKNSVRQKLQKMEADIAARENARKQAQIENNTKSALGIIGGIIIGGWLIKKGLEGLASGSGGGSYSGGSYSSDDNSSSSSSSSDDEDEKIKAEKLAEEQKDMSEEQKRKSEREAEEAAKKQNREDILNGEIDTPSHTMDKEWTKYGGMGDGTFYAKEVKFNIDKDGQTFRGLLCKGGNTEKLFIESLGGINHYYPKEEDAIRALYIYLKYEVVTKKGKDNN
jgi:hypothetical protein